MGRSLVLFVVSLLLILQLLSFLDSSGNGLLLAIDEYIDINGKTELLSSTCYSNGSGTQEDPFILSGFPENTTGLKLGNITGWVEVRDYSFNTSSEKYALWIENVSHCLIENITVNNHDKAILGENGTNLTINDTKFLNLPWGFEWLIPPQRYDPIHIDLGIGNLRFTNSTVSTKDYGTYSHGLVFRGNRVIFSGCDLEGRKDIEIESNDKYISIINCTFRNTSHMVPNLLSNDQRKFEIIDCAFFNSSLVLWNSIGIKVLNNRFLGIASTIDFGGLQYSDRPVSVIMGNVFEKSGGFSNTAPLYFPKEINRYEISDNYFGNCSYGPINWIDPKIRDVHIWKNIFYHNRNTGDTYQNGSQMEFDLNELNSANYSYSRNGIGNYWRDWTGPDIDGNGIVDIEYSFKESGGYDGSYNDPFPLTNPYFDVIKPGIIITQPQDPVNDYYMEYIKIEWEAWDHQTGLDSVLLSVDNENWTDVINE